MILYELPHVDHISKYNVHYFEAFLKVVVLFKKHCIINDDLWCGNAEVNNTIIYCFCRLQNSKKKKANEIKIQMSDFDKPY